jgi:hypothetical protein
MKKASKVIFFDNGCRVCRTGALLAGKSGIASQAELNELQEMNEEVSCDLDKARYCNEIAVYDVVTKESRYGIKGMIWFLEDKWGKWINVFLLPPIYQILNFFYHIFSYNRKMIAPVYDKVENDCKPEFHWFYRLFYLLFCIVISVCVSFVMGEKLVVVKYLDDWNGWWMLLFTGIGWGVHALLLLSYKVESKMEYLGHLATVMLSGILLQIPFLLSLSLFDNAGAWLILGLQLSDVLMHYLHYKRVKYLGVSQRITFAWSITLHVTAAMVFIAYVFYE